MAETTASGGELPASDSEGLPAGADAGGEGAKDAAREEYDALQDRYLRLAAEFENYRKRVARDHQERARSANADLLLELLGVVDNFERALEAEHDDSPYAAGVSLIYEQLQGLLARRGVERVQATGQRFDPELHEAILHIASDEIPAGHVCQDLRSGYLLNGRTLRPAQVAVSRGKTPGAPSDEVPKPDAQEKGIEGI